ncbi:Alpha/beta hydrolase fold-1 [Mycena polygramma]|nr:Alpha/beta hydrolase fold-1 [Mycena polygramma]
MSKKSSHWIASDASCPFTCMATKWTSSRNSDSSLNGEVLCLVLLSGVGLTSAVWTPVVDRLYSIQAKGGQIIGSIWAIDRPSHGDCAVLNEATFAARDGPSEYASAFAAFVTSSLLTQEERSNLAVVSHSAGVAALVYAPSAHQMKSRIRCVLLIEPTIFVDCDARVFTQWTRRLEMLFTKRKSSWKSVSEALASNKGWRRFHPEVQNIIVKTFFRQIGDELVSKTPPLHETAAFAEVACGVDIGRRLGLFIHTVPTHIMYGSRRDYWPQVLDEAFFAFVDKHRGLLSSVTRIPGEGHFVPQEAPDTTAASIHRALLSTITDTVFRAKL